MVLGRRSSFSPETDAITYNLGRTATPSTGHCADGKPCPLVTVNRSLTERLADRISVLDFGADGSCRGDIEATDDVAIEYAELVDAATLEPLETIDRPARLCVAAKIGTCRLIDNVGINDESED